MPSPRYWVSGKVGILATALLLTGSLVAVEAHAQNRTNKTKAAPRKAPKARGKPKAQGVRAMFQAAQKLYDQKKYYQALAAYVAIFKKYPTHEPTIIQMAKTYYRLDRLKDAYSMFTRLNPQYLDPETSFEYGMAFYTAKQWQGALYGFGRVTKDHSLFDLANYYGAICAIKLKRYVDAEEMLEKAVVLPEKLARSRKLYLKHVQALKLMKEKRSLAEERRKERRTAKGKRKGRKGKAPPAKDKGDETYSHAGKQGVSRKIAAGAEFTTTDKSYEFGNLIPGDDEEFERTNSITLQHGVLFPLPWRADKDRSSAFGIPLKAKGEWTQSTGTEERYAGEGAEDIVQVIREDKGVSDGKVASLSASPWIEFALPENTWLSLISEFYQEYPNFEAQDQNGYRKGGGRVWVGLDSYSFNLEGTYTDFYNTEGTSEFNETKIALGIGIKLPDDFSLGLDFTYKQFAYFADLPIEGPDRTTAAKAKFSKGLPFGIKLYTEGTYEAKEGYVVFNPNASFPQVSADGGTLAAKAGISLSPWSFLAVDVGYYYEQTDWSVILDNQPQKEEAFKKNVPRQINETFGSITLSDSF